MDPSARAISQYSNTSDRLALRVAILSYDTNPQTWYSWLEQRLDVTGDVLEVGSGTGELWRHIDSSRARLTLTDFSSAMCDKLRELQLPQAAIRQCDAAALPFSDSSFDLLIANHMLYHLDDPEAALREFARVLRPGGRLRVSLNGRDHIQELLELGAAVGRESPILDAARITAETAPDLLSICFEDVSAERFPGAFVVHGPEPVLGYLASWSDEPMTAAQQADARALVEQKIEREGRFEIRKNMVLFSATRSRPLS
ncbi:MAG: hypothetical protein L6R39_003407 [Caloplaca ligustica]|nr:MAG: hypothetical protein L6R39_003407 [Caloplaca ligustica]